MGMTKQGLQCRDCKYNACKKCVENGHVPEDCPGDIRDEPGMFDISFSN